MSEAILLPYGWLQDDWTLFLGMHVELLHLVDVHLASAYRKKAQALLYSPNTDIGLEQWSSFPYSPVDDQSPRMTVAKELLILMSACRKCRIMTTQIRTCTVETSRQGAWSETCRLCCGQSAKAT